MTIVEFLEARIAEDEEWAHGVAAQRELDASEGRFTYRQWLKGDPWPLPGDPARVLRECAARRAIVEQAQRIRDDWENGTGASYDYEQWLAYEESVLPCLASIYSDHADFDPSWSA